MIEIFFNNQSKQIEPNDSSVRNREIMGENSITLKFSLHYYFDFPLGAYINFQGERYTLNNAPLIKKQSDRNYDYTLLFDSYQTLLSNYILKDTMGRLKFPLTAKPNEHIELLVNNLNNNDTGWTVGDCIVTAEKLISYNHTSCAEALQTIADTFNTEWEIENKTIHLKKVEHYKDNPLHLSYGKGNGFKSGIARGNDEKSKGFNVLYVQGGERNIDFSKYGHKELLLPKSQQYTYEGVTYLTDSEGLSVIRDEPITNRIEASLDLSNIYPKREGTISQVITQNIDKHFYDIIDSSIPENLNFKECLIANNEPLKIVFQSGMLAGREFQAMYTHDERRFEIVPEPQDDKLMPDEIFKPQVGDKYAVFNMQMPNAYICDDATKTGASWELFIEACKFFHNNQHGQFTFNGEIDGIWAKKDWVNVGGRLRLGGYVMFSDTEFQPEGVLIRITSIKDYINNPHSPKIGLSNSVQGKSLYSQIFKNKELEVVQEHLYKKGKQYSKRQWSNVKETIKLLEGAIDGFGKGINPLTVETMSLLVGSENLQFVFVNSKTNPQQAIHNITFNATKQLIADSGILQHKTLGIKTITTTHNASDYKYWILPKFTSAVLDSKEPYFLYAKCSKTSETGQFILSKTAIKMEEISGYYHFLVGIANSETNNERSFTTLYGFTEVLPGRITTDVIKSANNNLIIDLVNGTIQGKMTFSSDSPALNQVADVAQGVAGHVAGDVAGHVAGQAVERLVDSLNFRNALPKKNVDFIQEYKGFHTPHIEGLSGPIAMGGDFYFDNNLSNNEVGFTLFFTTLADDWQNGDRTNVFIAHKFTDLQGGKWHHLYFSDSYFIGNKHTHIKGWFADTASNNIYPDKVKNLYINYASKDLGYTIPPEEIEALQASDYLTKALKDTTDINGGLVLASVIGAKNDSGAVKSYMSGNNALNQIAFAAGVNNFGTQGETQNVAINHNGAAKIGVFEIDEQGNVSIYNAQRQDRLRFINSDIPTLSDMMDKADFSNDYEHIEVEHLSTDQGSDYGYMTYHDIEIPKKGGVLNASCHYKMKARSEYEWHPSDDYYNPAIPIADDNDTVSLEFKIKLEQQTLTSNDRSMSYGSDGEGTQSGNMYLSVQPYNTGTYRFEIVANFSSSNYLMEAEISNVKLHWSLNGEDFRKLLFGVNGLLGAFPNKLIYFSEQEGFVVKSDKVNFPGVLCTGSANKFGVISNYWGICPEGGVERQSQGVYRIYHNIGHKYYTVTATPHSIASVAVGSRTETYVEVGFFSINQFKDMGFDFVIYGRNFA